MVTYLTLMRVVLGELILPFKVDTYLMRLKVLEVIETIMLD